MLPQQEPVAKNKLLTIGGILMLLFYTFQNFIPGIGLLPRIAALSITVLIVVVSLLLFLPELKRDVPAFFKHIREYSRFFFPKFGIFFIAYYLVAFTITLIAQVPAANQALLENFPLPLLAFSALLYAPLVEETVYRGFLRRVVRDDTFFIIVSALIFGTIHMLHGGQTAAQYLYIIEYCMLGGFLAYIYVKSDNICVAILGHFCLNFVAFIPMLFI